MMKLKSTMSGLPITLILILVLASMAPLVNASSPEESEDDLERLPPPLRTNAIGWFYLQRRASLLVHGWR